MDTEQNRTNDPNDRGESPDPLAELGLNEDVDAEIDEVDDTAILNDLLRDLSPQSLDEESSTDAASETAPPKPPAPEPKAAPKVEETVDEEPEPAPAVVDEPPPAKAPAKPAASEGSWLFDDSLDEEAAEPAVPGESAAVVEEEPVAEEPAPAAPVEEKPAPAAAPDDSGSWLFDDSIEEKGTTVQEAAEPPIAEAEPEGEDTFSEQTLDEAFAALEGTDEPTTEPVADEAPADDSAGGLFDESALVGAFAGLGDSADEVPDGAVAEAPVDAADDAVETVTPEVPMEAASDDASVADSVDVSDTLVGGLSTAIAEHLLTRMAPSSGMIAPPPSTQTARAVDEPSEEPALTADVEDEFFIAAEEGDAIEESGGPDVAELLTEDLAAIDIDDGPAPGEPEPSLDDLITSAVLDPGADQPAPDFSEPEGVEQASADRPPPAPVGTGGEADDELDQLIREMKARQKKRRIIMSVVGVLAIAAVAYLALREPAPEGDGMAPTPQVSEQPMDANVEADDMAAPQPEPETPQPEPETPQTTAVPAPTPATRAPVPAPAGSGRDQLATAIGSRTPPPAPTPAPTPPRSAPAARRPQSDPRGVYTVHVESHSTSTGSEQGRQKWRRRGFEHVLVWSWVNPADGRQWYRLGVGRYGDRQMASAAKEYLKGEYPREIDWSPVTRIPEGAR